MTIAAVLLAAGRSTRFGAENKLLAPMDGIPLGLHAANMLARLPVDRRIVVTGAAVLEWPGFTPIENDRPETGMAHSIALGVAAARRGRADAVLIALADMPFVSEAHYRRLLACHRGPGSRAASSDGSRPTPPALFGADWFDTLEQLSGDQGARALLGHAELVAADPRELVDIDRPSDLPARP